MLYISRMNPGESDVPSLTRRNFINKVAIGGIAFSSAIKEATVAAQEMGERPVQSKDVIILNPKMRVPIGLIIDDSTCLVNLNRFAMPQFDAAFGGNNKAYKKNWRDWPVEIPDSFVRKFGEWCAENGVKGKYSVVPYPACVGRLDRMLPGWTQAELERSIELVRTIMMPNWDIHPEMVTHTRVIDLKTGHPYPEISLKYMENWDWTTNRSAEEITDYMAYALNILKNIGLNCEGITTPGGFGSRARPQLAKATLESVRSVFKAEIPHYFRDVYESGSTTVAPKVQLVSGIDSNDPRCVVSIFGCTGDWTGSWDCSTPEGADKFITPDLSSGRMVDVIQRGEPAIMVCHWTGIFWNGEERGFKIFQEVVRRLKTRFDNLIGMKLSEIARYWAAKELTGIEKTNDSLQFKAPFSCPDFTVKVKVEKNKSPVLSVNGENKKLREVGSEKLLSSDTFTRQGDGIIACFTLSRGKSRLLLSI